MSELPTGWAETTLGEVSEPRVDQGGPDRSQSSFCYVDISSIDRATKRIADPQRLPVDEAPSRAKQRLLPGDVLVSMTRPNLNAVAIVTDDLADCIGSTGFHVLRCRSVSPLWTYYRVQASDFVSTMSMKVQGALYPAVRPNDIAQFATSIPSRPEQNRIVDEIEKQFTRLDAATTALKRVQANLKRYRASVLKAACEGRLVPTEAELARKEGHDYEPADQLLQRILRERRTRWEADTLAKMIAAGKATKDDRWKQKYKEPATPDTTGLPSLPEGWCWATLGQMTSLITSGSRGWGDRYSASGPVFIRAQDIKTDSLILGDVAHVQLPEDSEGTRTRVRASDLLVTITGANVTKAALVGMELDEAYVSQHVGLIRPVLSETAQHLYAWIMSPMQGRAELLRLAYGAGKPGLNLDNLRELCIAVAPIAEQQRIQTETSRILSSADSLESTLDTSHRRGSSLRKAILKDAFAGKLAPQHPADEPASVLLERIHADREQSGSRTTRIRKEEAACV